MKRFPLLILVAVVALLACNERQTQDDVKPQSVITLQWSVLESPITQTRLQSTAEATLNNLWLFVFNSSGTLEQKNKARVVRNDTHTADVTIKEGSGMNFYTCANVSASQEAKFDGLVNGVARLADLKAITSDLSQLTAPGLPMWGELLNQTITATTTRVNMTLTRNCSRVDVVANNIADFGVYGIEKLLKTATVGPIFPGSSLASASSTTDIVPTNKALYSIYLYENAIVAPDEATAEGKATAIIIKGIYKGIPGYYKLRVKYNSAPVKYDIGRNVIYSLNITNVKAPGFATLAEAEANFPQNVDYTLTASDGEATDLVTSNGQYYLGVTNSDYVAYNSDPIIDAVVVTVTHNAPSSITAGSVTASGAGLTLRTTTIPTSTQKQEIRVDMANYFTSGTLTLRLGNLIKVVTLTKKPTLNMGGGLNSDYSGVSYVQGDWDEDPSWSRFATNTSMGGFTTRRVQNPSGGIWMRLDSNIGQRNTPRSAGAYVTSIDSKGRSRIVLKQESAALEYVSGAPSENITWNPAPFTVNVKTDLPGWTIKAKDAYMQPFPITLGAKTGTPVRGTPANCSISFTVPNNPGAERTIYLYLCASEDPTMEIVFAWSTQDKVPATISISSAGAGGIPYYGGVAATTVTSSHAWYVSSSLAGVVITPASGGAGSTSVSISMPVNLSPMSRTANITFSATSAGYTARAVFGCDQLASPALAGSYIPRSVLEAAGWPTNRLSAIGLQIATRGERVFPGGTSAGADPQWQWCAVDPPLTPNVETATGPSTGKLGNGGFNTDMMIQDNACPAASYCRQMGPEWYLPSARELSLISDNVALLGSAYTFPKNSKYWTSTQFYEQESHVWIVGGGWGRQDKNERWYVRCVRNI